jgi:hypothetical protein
MPPEGGAPEGGAPPAEAPPAGGGGEITPESFDKKDMNLILEQTLFNKDNTLDLSRGRMSLNEIEKEISNLLNK